MELLVVVGIAAVCMAVTIAVSPHFIRTAKADSGVIQARDVFRSARETAISERRNVRVEFIGTDRIQTVREDIGAGGLVVGTTVIRTVQLEGRLQFLLVSGVPDTPDGFSPAPTVPASFGASANRKFTSEGTFVNAQGDLMNGTLFLAVEGEANSARAITVFGATALLRTWRWDGGRWTD